MNPIATIVFDGIDSEDSEVAQILFNELQDNAKKEIIINEEKEKQNDIMDMDDVMENKEYNLYPSSTVDMKFSKNLSVWNSCCFYPIDMLYELCQFEFGNEELGVDTAQCVFCKCFIFFGT